jgi:hypothetical protein
MTSTYYFQCDSCRIECRVETVISDCAAPFAVQHCPDSAGITVAGKVTQFPERRDGLWADVQHWIDAA